LLIFFALFLTLQGFEQEKPSDSTASGPVVLETAKKEYIVNHPIELLVTNTTSEVVAVANDCPSEPLDVFRYVDGDWEQVESSSDSVVCSDDLKPLLLVPFETLVVDYRPWVDTVFSEFGRYKIELSLVGSDDTVVVVFTEFEISDRGLVRSIGYTFFYRPLYNFLVYLAWVLPGKNLGFALLALTVLIRIVLLIPNHKALVSQRAMQKIQPEIEAIKKKHGTDQQKVAAETMQLWKRHKVSPVNSCLPLLIQFPILIALFYVVRDGITPYSAPILYDFLSIDLSSIDMIFLGLIDLSQVNFTWLPVVVGFMQFIQMKLSFAKISNKSDTKILDVSDTGDGVRVKEVDKQKPMDPMKSVSKMMIYFMPFMIAIMTATLPSGVGFYWGISTAFGIGQQLVVNRKH
jgi:YidC/Oxa1 family membrane protein insertase